MRRRATFTGLALIAAAVPALAAGAQQIEAEELLLDNGMKFLLVRRTEQPNSIACGWVARVGSANEHPGITGISHFFEHMMFKGTRTIGTRDAEADAAVMARAKAVKDRLDDLVLTVQYDRWRRGEIEDPWDPRNDTDEMKSLRAELREATEAHRDIIVKNEFDEVYTRNGASNMNAFTTEDMTFYIITIPSNKFELWAWMESDRLRDSVFREFYSERDVVHEERRLRTESTPTGEFDEQFNAMFWQSSPYAWPVVGWPSDLNSYTREEAERYFNIYYRPNNLIGVVVGDFRPEEVRPKVREYFGRLSRGEDPPHVVTLEVPQKAPMIMQAECDCQPQIEIRYHTVPFDHADSFALDVLASILNGRTGRLYKTMIEGREIASSAAAGQDSRKYGGAFSFSAEVKGDATPAALEKAWWEEIERIKREPVGERELQKVKNQDAANTYRRLQSNFFLMLQLGILDATSGSTGPGWRYINEEPVKVQAVTAADIQRVAEKYFVKTNASTAVYTRKAGPAAAEDPELAAIEEPMRSRIKQQVAALQMQTDVARLTQQATMIEAFIGQVPEDQRPAILYVIRKTKERIAELEKAEE